MTPTSTPNNPTGAAMPRSALQAIIDLARPRGIIILADEVHHPLIYNLAPSDPGYPPPLVTMGYDKVISTNSVSKAYALPRVRLGWIATLDRGIMDALSSAGDYTTISVSQIDDQIAAFALGENVRGAVLERSMEICRRNMKLIDQLLRRHDRSCS